MAVARGGGMFSSMLLLLGRAKLNARSTTHNQTAFHSSHPFDFIFCHLFSSSLVISLTVLSAVLCCVSQYYQQVGTIALTNPHQYHVIVVSVFPRIFLFLLLPPKVLVWQGTTLSHECSRFSTFSVFHCVFCLVQHSPPLPHPNTPHMHIERPRTP